MTQQEIEKRGYRVTRRGQAWLIVGRGLSILVADLKVIGPRDLLPTAPSTQIHLHEGQKS